MTEPGAELPKRRTRVTEIVVGAIAGGMGTGMIALGLLGAYRQLTEPSRMGAGLWAFIAGLCLVGGFLALKGFSFVRGTRVKPVELPSGQVRRRPIVAALLSLLVSGVGQLYNGQWRKGIAFYLAALAGAALLLSGVTGRTFWGWLLTAAAVIAVQITAIVDAAVTARRARIISVHRFSSWLLLVPTAVAMSLAFFAVRSLQVVKTFYLPTESMSPTLLLNDHVVADLGYYDEHPLTVGAVVLFRSPEDSSVEITKRVVALPGDRVEIRKQVLYVNGRPAHEPWAVHRDPRPFSLSPALRRRDNLDPIVVPEGAFFALGDNRDHSYDSRYFGAVPRESLRGKLLFVYWSADRSRIGRAL